MLIKLLKTHVEEVTAELKLPAFFKHCGSFYMITENETLVQISEDSIGGIYIFTWTKENHFNPQRIADVIAYTTASPYEFFKVWHTVMDHLENNIKQPLLK